MTSRRFVTGKPLRMEPWRAEESQPRDSLEDKVPFTWGLCGAQVHMEAGPLTLAVGEMEVEY